MDQEPLMSSSRDRRTPGQETSARRPRPVTTVLWTALLAAVFIAVPSGPAGWAAVAASVPVALAAVAAAVSVTSRPSGSGDPGWVDAAQAGLAAAAATVLVGVAWSFVVAPPQETGLALMLGTLPAMAGLALALCTAGAALGWAWSARRRPTPAGPARPGARRRQERRRRRPRPGAGPSAAWSARPPE